MMTIREDTPLRDILAVYPWLIDEAVQLDDRFRLLKTPIGRMLLKKATVADAAKYLKRPASRLLSRLEGVIRNYESNL